MWGVEMVKKSGKKINSNEADLDLTSMIDVCFLLIAFFIMVTEVTKSEIVEIFLPHASFAQIDTHPPDNRVIVNIDRAGEVWIHGFNYGQPNFPDNKQVLERELVAFAEKVGYDKKSPGKPSNLTVLVRADAHAANKYVQCVQLLLSQAKVQKLHYSAKNPDIGL